VQQGVLPALALQGQRGCPDLPLLA